jgi:hypothetical protein
LIDFCFSHDFLNNFNDLRVEVILINSIVISIFIQWNFKLFCNDKQITMSIQDWS